ncbi:MAG: histidinol-phosphate transaminase, partial [Halieaceae bacterium]|nr:histidinol-phosphate transaminase [Halieaceae bacterium]
MSRYWSDLVGSLQPYVPGEQPRQERLLKLNTNESPYDPSPKVVEAIAGVSANRLRLYPDPESSALKQAFGAYNGLKPEQVFMGNGSDEVLAHVFQALLKHDLPLCFPEISYSFYPVWCDLYGVSYRAIPLRDDFTVDIAGFPKANGGLLLPNPNAPTGIVLPLSEIGGLLENNPDSVVVIDEAYIDFGGESAVRLIDQFDNLLVVQTLSKSRALAGMRVGVAMGSSDLIEGLERVKNSFNSYPLDIVAQRAALSALEDESYFLDTCQRVIATRERLTAAMQLLGFLVLPSSANFVFATHPRRAAKDLLQGLREQGILVRYFDKPG